MGEVDVPAVLAACGEAELTALLDAGRANDVGVGGGSSVCHVDGVPVFAKRIPLTEEELARPRDTANIYDVPAQCQYGIRGPGVNGWRELEANLLVGDCPTAFPRLYHWRVLPGRAPIAAEHEDVDAIVAWYGGSPAVRARMAALAAAPSSLVLFQQYVPYPLRDWWRDDPVGKAPIVERQFAEITGFLRERELLHMDGHVGNMRSDGERIYLTDFGLATSPRFRLSEAERAFAARNAGHDAGYASMVLVNWLVVSVCGAPLPTSGGPVARNEYVIRCARGDIPADVPPVVAAILARHAPVAARMNAFYWRLFDGEMDAEFPG